MSLSHVSLHSTSHRLPNSVDSIRLQRKTGPTLANLEIGLEKARFLVWVENAECPIEEVSDLDLEEGASTIFPKLEAIVEEDAVVALSHPMERFETLAIGTAKDLLPLQLPRVLQPGASIDRSAVMDLT